MMPLLRAVGWWSLCWTTIGVAELIAVGTTFGVRIVDLLLDLADRYRRRGLLVELTFGLARVAVAVTHAVEGVEQRLVLFSLYAADRARAADRSLP